MSKGETDPTVIVTRCDDGVHLFYPPTLTSGEVADLLGAALVVNEEGG